MFDDITSVFTVLGCILLYLATGVVLSPRIMRGLLGDDVFDNQAPLALAGLLVVLWPLLVFLGLAALGFRTLGRLALRQRPRKDPPVPPAHTHKEG